MTRATAYAEINKEVAALIAQSGDPNAAALIFRAAMLQVRAQAGAVRAAELAVALGNEMLGEVD